MLRLGLMICGLGTFISTEAWGRAEFHLGGTEGNVWQELVEGGEGEYAAVDAEGNIVGVFPVSSVPQEPVADPLMKDSGKVVMIDFADNTLRPVLIDPAENLSLSIAERGGDINTSIHVRVYQRGKKDRRTNRRRQYRNSDAAPRGYLAAPRRSQHRQCQEYSSQLRSRVTHQPHSLLSAAGI